MRTVNTKTLATKTTMCCMCMCRMLYSQASDMAGRLAHMSCAQIQ